jgi:hypothetical protein
MSEWANIVLQGKFMIARLTSHRRGKYPEVAEISLEYNHDVVSGNEDTVLARSFYVISK